MSQTPYRELSTTNRDCRRFRRHVLIRLFTAPDGRKLRPQYLTDHWMAARKRLGVTWTLHSMRHAHISQLLAAGVPIKVVQRRAGHSNVATTLNTYAHVLPGQDEAAATVFAKVMNGEQP